MRSRVCLALAVCALACRAIPDAPTAIAYDRETCAHCHMLIGDPRYAVQLVTGDGDVLDFDDPGCALRYLAEARPVVHRLWFRDASRDRWITSGDVRFARGADTPMGSGLAASDGALRDGLDLGRAIALATGGSP